MKAKLALLIASCVVALLACENPQGASSATAGEAEASLSVSFSMPAPRSVVASPANLAAAISTLAIAVVDLSNTTVASASGIAYGAGVVHTFGALSPGAYTVRVNAYSAASALIATGSSPVTVAANLDQTVNVNLGFSQAASSGGFSLALRWPMTTGLAYVRATLDGAAIAVPAVTSGGGNYSATLARSSVAGGSHVLAISFKPTAASTIVIGPFIEAVNIWDGVTSRCWVDSSGNSAGERLFAASEFPDSGADMSALSVNGASLSSAFAPGNTGYSLTGMSAASFTFSATTAFDTQDLSYTWNGVAQAWSGVAGSTFSSASLTWVTGINTLVVTVTAADRVTKKAYTLTTPAIQDSSNLASTFNSVGSNILIADATVSGPLSGYFTGTLDGNGHTITISGGTLFSWTAVGSTVKNLKLKGSVAGGESTGSIAGQNGGTISNCTSEAIVTANGSYAGGLVGINYGLIENSGFTGSVTVPAATGFETGGVIGRSEGGTLYRCYSTGVVSGGEETGGLAGSVVNGGSVDQCYATGAVTGTMYVGGLIGSSGFTNITNSYARGFVTGQTYVGGFIGAGMVAQNCYATGNYSAASSGGFFAGNNPAGNYNYVASPAGGFYYLSTLATAVPAAWDALIWGRSPSINNGYPHLLYFGSNTKLP